MGYCTWAGMNDTNRIYHDKEWGVPVHDDRQMFERLFLECMQRVLSWDLMLKKHLGIAEVTYTASCEKEPLQLKSQA